MKKGFGWEKTNSSKKDAAKYQVRVTDTLAKDQEGSQEWKLKSEGWKLATCRIVIRWLKEITIEVLKPNQLQDKKSRIYCRKRCQKSDPSRADAKKSSSKSPSSESCSERFTTSENQDSELKTQEPKEKKKKEVWSSWRKEKQENSQERWF